MTPATRGARARPSTRPLQASAALALRDPSVLPGRLSRLLLAAAPPARCSPRSLAPLPATVAPGSLVLRHDCRLDPVMILTLCPPPRGARIPAPSLAAERGPSCETGAAPGLAGVSSARVLASAAVRSADGSPDVLSSPPLSASSSCGSHCPSCSRSSPGSSPSAWCAISVHGTPRARRTPPRHAGGQLPPRPARGAPPGKQNRASGLPEITLQGLQAAARRQQRPHSARCSRAR